MPGKESSLVVGVFIQEKPDGIRRSEASAFLAIQAGYMKPASQAVSSSTAAIGAEFPKIYPGILDGLPFADSCGD